MFARMDIFALQALKLKKAPQSAPLIHTALLVHNILAPKELIHSFKDSYIRMNALSAHQARFAPTISLQIYQVPRTASVSLIVQLDFIALMIELERTVSLITYPRNLQILLTSVWQELTAQLVAFGRSNANLVPTILTFNNLNVQNAQQVVIVTLVVWTLLLTAQPQTNPFTAPQDLSSQRNADQENSSMMIGTHA